MCMIIHDFGGLFHLYSIVKLLIDRKVGGEKGSKGLQVGNEVPGALW